MDGIQTSYNQNESDSDTGSNAPLSLNSLTKNPLPYVDDVLWSLAYKGFNIQAQLSGVETLLVINISAAGYPPIVLKFKRPFAERIFISLPGGALLIRICALYEVSVWSVDGRYTRSEEQEFNRVCQLIEQLKTFDEVEYCQSMVWIHKSNRRQVYSIEVFAGLLASNEALVALSAFRNFIIHPHAEA